MRACISACISTIICLKDMGMPDSAASRSILAACHKFSQVSCTVILARGSRVPLESDGCQENGWSFSVIFF